ncbi:hypothetical protein BHM03_00035143, partial [Ensete ventricosum]
TPRFTPRALSAGPERDGLNHPQQRQGERERERQERGEKGRSGNRSGEGVEAANLLPALPGRSSLDKRGRNEEEDERPGRAARIWYRLVESERSGGGQEGVVS